MRKTYILKENTSKKLYHLFRFNINHLKIIIKLFIIIIIKLLFYQN